MADEAAEEESAFLADVASSVSASLASISTSALSGAVAGERFALATPNIEMLAERADADALAGAPLEAAAGAASFVLPDAAVAAARAAGGGAAVASVDVQLANFAVNLHAYHPSAARAVGRLSELTLRDTDGGAALAVTNLSSPIQIALPLAPDLETHADDANPYLGASCDGPSRAACEAELLALNETHNAKNDECRGVEGSAASIFTPSAVDECIAAAEAAAEAVRQKEAECEALEIEHCSGRGSCTAAGVCACDGGYYGATCGRVLQCAWWNESAGFEGSGCAAAGVDGAGRLVCECNHLTLFEVLWEVDWSDAETFTTIEFPMLSLPFSRWGQLWELLWSLSWQAYVLVAVVLVVLSILLLWARYKDRQNEYVAYMPRWYRAVRAVETAARHSDRCVVRIAAWPVLFILWFATNHPWIVVFLVKPSSSFKHAHLVMMLYNMVLAELCFFVVFFGYEQSGGADLHRHPARRGVEVDPCCS